MKWERMGLVWAPDGSTGWAATHATCPTPYRRRDGGLRMYLQCRDPHNVGRVGYVDLDPGQPSRVVGVSAEPVLDIGVPGAFDDNGVFQTSLVRLPDGRLFLYYVGFELCHHIRYRLLTGLAVSEDDGDSFVRVRTTPILERSPGELHFRCGPCVLYQDGRFRMWYVAGSRWETIEGKPMPVYDIRTMESDDGIRWPEEGQPAMAVDLAVEHGFGRPWIMPRAGGGLQMHYSVRRRSPARYQLGWAHSADGLAWVRQDDALQLCGPAAAWEQEALCYGAEFESNGARWLVYNGRDFGADGFGIARLAEA